MSPSSSWVLNFEGSIVGVRQGTGASPLADSAILVAYTEKKTPGCETGGHLAGLRSTEIILIVLILQAGGLDGCQAPDPVCQIITLAQVCTPN